MGWWSRFILILPFLLPEVGEARQYENDSLFTPPAREKALKGPGTCNGIPGTQRFCDRALSITDKFINDLADKNLVKKSIMDDKNNKLEYFLTFAKRAWNCRVSTSGPPSKRTPPKEISFAHGINLVQIPVKLEAGSFCRVQEADLKRQILQLEVMRPFLKNGWKSQTAILEKTRRPVRRRASSDNFGSRRPGGG